MKLTSINSNSTPSINNKTLNISSISSSTDLMMNNLNSFNESDEDDQDTRTIINQNQHNFSNLIRKRNKIKRQKVKKKI